MSWVTAVASVAAAQQASAIGKYNQSIQNRNAEVAEQKAEAERWCDRFEENTRKWLKSTIGVHGDDGHPVITYEDIDTTLIPPRPRLYGLVGGEVIEQVWKERSEKATEPVTVG